MASPPHVQEHRSGCAPMTLLRLVSSSRLSFLDEQNQTRFHTHFHTLTGAAALSNRSVTSHRDGSPVLPPMSASGLVSWVLSVPSTELIR